MEGTIFEEYSLPSKGKVYSQPVNPEICLRSMTTEDEMKRLSHSNSQYKLLSEIIDDCLTKKIGIPAYDLCVSDYQYLLHKLRVVTYGADYPIEPICPVCGYQDETSINLDDLEVVEYDDELSKYLNITLPVSKNKLKLRVQTPRLMDWVTKKVEELNKKTNSKSNTSAFLFTIMSLIETIDGETYDEMKLESYVRKLDMKDTNYILQCAKKFDFGINTTIECECPRCNSVYKANIPITEEFFRPRID